MTERRSIRIDAVVDWAKRWWTVSDEESSGMSRTRRVVFYVSALAAAFACTAVLANYVVMPLIVRRGDLVAASKYTDRSLVEALRMADEDGLAIRVDVERPDPGVPAGYIIEQSPAPGVAMKRGRTVAVVVSAGQDRRAVPRLTGLTGRQAQLEAEQAGFAVADVVEAHTDAVERGRVVATDPTAGAVLPAGSSIRILVSLGRRPRTMMMPSLIGRLPEEARLIAEGLGLVVRSVQYESGRRSRVLRDVVVVQDPVPGSMVTEGDGITLRVGKR